VERVRRFNAVEAAFCIAKLRRSDKRRGSTMSRWKAFAIHLSLSVAVGVAVLALLFCVWYPQPYFVAAGGQHLVLVLLSVDLVLGPLLTLILFKSGKKGMLFDLWTIGILQFAALVYGLNVIAESRPVFIAASVDRFTVVAANDIRNEDLAKGGKEEYRSRSWTGPRLVSAPVPSDPAAQSRLIDLNLKGIDVHQLPEYYAAYPAEVPNLLSRAKTIAQLRKLVPTSRPVIDEWLKKSIQKEDGVVWVPINARKASLVMLLDKSSGEPLAALPIEPW
jgi:hypothetical protein